MWNDIELHALIARAAATTRCSAGCWTRSPAWASRAGAAPGGWRTVREQSARDHRGDRRGDRGARRGGGQRGHAAPSGERRTGGERMIERPGKIVAIGLNYMDHVRESGTEPPKRPLVFAKFTTSVINHEEQIRIPRKLTERVDWEVELAVIIGETARHVSEDDALEVRARLHDRQRRLARATCSSPTGSGCARRAWTRSARSARSVVELDDPQNLKLATRVNGETMQDSSTREMIFGVAELISFCSHSLHARARRRDPHRHALGLRRVHGARSARSRTATSSSARSRASACCATRSWRSR